MTARLEDTQRFHCPTIMPFLHGREMPPHPLERWLVAIGEAAEIARLRDRQLIPLFAHELQPIRRIGYHRIHRVLRQRPHNLDAVALIERPVRLRPHENHLCTSYYPPRTKAAGGRCGTRGRAEWEEGGILVRARKGRRPVGP